MGEYQGTVISGVYSAFIGEFYIDGSISLERYSNISIDEFYIDGSISLERYSIIARAIV